MKTAREWMKTMGNDPYADLYGRITVVIRQAQQEAYKQGAEDMRDAAERACRSHHDMWVNRNDYIAAASSDCQIAVSALPIPAMPEGE